mgnify:CR=1 FL=1
MEDNIMKAVKFRFGVLVMVALAVNFLNGCGTPGADQNVSNSPSAANTKANTELASAPLSATCTAEDDKQIAAQIRILIDGDPALRPHRKHINYSTKICKVTLRGWVDTFDNFKNLYDKVSNAGGVRSVNISGFELRPQAPSPSPGVGTEKCPDGTKECGELCIPKDENCEIIID